MPQCAWKAKCLGGRKWWAQGWERERNKGRKREGEKEREREKESGGREREKGRGGERETERQESVFIHAGPPRAQPRPSLVLIKPSDSCLVTVGTGLKGLAYCLLILGSYLIPYKFPGWWEWTVRKWLSRLKKNHSILCLPGKFPRPWRRTWMQNMCWSPSSMHQRFLLITLIPDHNWV